MSKNMRNGMGQIANDSAIPSVTIRIPMPSNVKAPAKAPTSAQSKKSAR